jgi:predicted outer membrane repeat protein
MNTAGAALYLLNSAHSNITNCIFKNNRASVKGGAMYFENDVNHMTILQSLFVGNEAVDGGGCLYLFEYNDYLSIAKTNFISNSAAAGDGGAIYGDEYDDNMSIEGCQFFNNTAGGNGGAIMVREKSHHFYLGSSTFSENSANNGGAVFLETSSRDIRIESSSFTNNVAVFSGGACVLYSSLTDVTLTHNNFTQNTAGANGGAVFMFISVEDVTISDCDFIDNIANSGDALTVSRRENLAMGGGAVYVDVSNARIALTRCFMRNNSAPFASGGACFINSNNRDITFLECNQTGNFAYRGGGGLYIGSANTNVLVHRSVLANNTADLIGGGACLMLTHNTVTFSHTIISENRATVGGGLLCFLNNFYFEVKNCVLEGNRAAMRGGAINVGILHEIVLIEGTKFVDNWAVEGGALSVEDQSSVAIRSCDFLANIAYQSDSEKPTTVNGEEVYTTFGGAVFSTSDDLSIALTTFEQNGADDGGALYVIGENISITDSVFTGNTAENTGGAASFSGCTDVVLSACNLTSNGNVAVAIEKSKTITVVNTRIVDSVGINGAAISCSTSDGLTISSSFFAGNVVSGVGGALRLNNNIRVRVETSVLEGNSAQEAGAIYVYESSSVSLYGNLFNSNNATLFGGGAVLLLNAADSTVRSNTFENNSAELGGGGAVFWLYNGGAMQEPAFLSSNQFAGNVALYGDDLATDTVQMKYMDEDSTMSDGVVVLAAADVLVVEMNVYEVAMLWPVTLVDMYNQIVANQISVLQASALGSPLQSQCGDQSPYLTGQTMAPIEGGVSTLEFTSSCEPNGHMLVSFTTDLESVPALEIELRFRNCARGEYYSNGACVMCPNGTYSLEEHTNDTTVTTCSTCPTHATCYGDVIVVDAGYWRLSGDVVRVFSCPLEGSCVGGLDTGTELCNVGYTGVLCGVCDANYYYPSLKATCEACTDSDMQVGLIVVVAIVALVMLGLGISCCGRRIAQELNSQTGMSFLTYKWRATNLTFAAKKKQFLKSEDVARKYQNKLKQLITLFQILTAFPSILSTTFPTIYYHLTSAFNVINLGTVLKDLGLVCSFNDLNFISTVVGATVAPILFSMALYLVHRVHCHLVFHQYSSTFRGIANTESRIEVLKSTYQYVFLFFTYLILPGVSTVLFGMLKPCTNVDPDDAEGGNQLYLEADLSIRCEGPQYNFGVIWASIGCIVYPFGIPCYYFYLLYHSKGLIQSRAEINVATLSQKGLNELEQIGMKLSSIKFLFQEYQPKFWYFEIIETFRKLFLTSFLSVISPGSTKQLVFGNLFVVLCLILYVCMGPFDDLELTVTSAICQLQIWFILFLGILIKENVHISSTFIEVSVAFAILFILVYEIFWCIVEFCPLPKAVQEFFDRVIVSKSHTSPPSDSAVITTGHKQKRKLGNNVEMEDAVERVLEVLSQSMSDDDDDAQGSPALHLDEKVDLINQNFILFDKLQVALKDHQDALSERIRSLEVSDDEEEEEGGDDDDGRDIESFKTEKQKGFVNTSSSFKLIKHNNQYRSFNEAEDSYDEVSLDEGSAGVDDVEMVGL